MKKIGLDVESLRVTSFATQDSQEWSGTVLAHAVTVDAAHCTTKTQGCPITWGCPYTTP
ncbi:MAG: hypothetical protein JO306_16765 [Gemmatimonadetes bacterium]|nr:hypothetical protein [Gemmatimonadota bacterium]